MGAFAQSWLVSPGISPSGILFVSLGKVFILALEGTRFPSLLNPDRIGLPQLRRPSFLERIEKISIKK